MDCRVFRSLHGDWVDDVLDPTGAESLTRHILECAACARFDTMARRALMVARNAPPIEVSGDFSARLAARIADERRRRIAQHAPSHVERRRPAAGSPTWVRVAAAVVIVAGGTIAFRATVARPAQSTLVWQGTDSAAAAEANAVPTSRMSAIPGLSSGNIVVVRALRPVGGALLPVSDDPLFGSDDGASIGDVRATTVAATAPLWPTAQMAAHAANRFAAMEFGDMIPVSVIQTSR
jgi:Putative zinc-finger